MTRAADPACVRCGHTAHHHRLDDATNISPTDPAAQFRCVWPMPDRLPRQVNEPACTCPDMVVPADAGWPFNNAPEPTPGADRD